MGVIVLCRPSRYLEVPIANTAATKRPTPSEKDRSLGFIDVIFVIKPAGRLAA